MLWFFRRRSAANSDSSVAWTLQVVRFLQYTYHSITRSAIHWQRVSHQSSRFCG